MSSALLTLKNMVADHNRFDLPYNDVQALQLEAVNELFQQQKSTIKLLAHRAQQANIDHINSLADLVPLLFPHTVYKSYPESFLMNKRWDKLAKWLQATSSVPVPVEDPEQYPDIDSWLASLEKHGVFVNCSSGTTGKSAMLVSSNNDMDWLLTEAVAAYTWGSGVSASNDRKIFGMAPVALTPRNTQTGVAYRNALQRPDCESFAYPVPPITVGSLTSMVVLRKKIAEGTATPQELQDFEETSKVRQQQMEDAVGIAAQAIIADRGLRLHISGMWASLYAIAVKVREAGYSAKDFDPENSIYVGGGLKRAKLPDDYREFVYETFNIQPERNYQNYSMQELQSGMPRCREGNRYHIPPWVIPLVLDKTGETVLPHVGTEIEGRAAFVDLSLEGRWGGVITGDKVSIDYSTCSCGACGPSIRDDIMRYADIEGDDKIGCAGTVDAYVRGMS